MFSVILAVLLEDQADISAWAIEAVRDLTLRNIMTGYDDGTFGPQDNVTREQLATTLSRYDGQKGRLYANEDVLNFFNSKYIHNYEKGVNVHLNQEDPNELVQYINLEKRMQMEVPYNARWGTEEYRLEPFGQLDGWGLAEEGFSFGPLFLYGEAYSFIRQYQLSFGEPITAADLVETLESDRILFEKVTNF